MDFSTTQHKCTWDITSRSQAQGPTQKSGPRLLWPGMVRITAKKSLKVIISLTVLFETHQLQATGNRLQATGYGQWS